MKPFVLTGGVGLCLSVSTFAAQSSASFVTPEGLFSQAVTSFGARLRVSGDTAIVGCRPSRYGAGTSAAYFYDRTASGWTYAQTFGGASRYSISVDISGDRAVVGAPYISGEKMYIYERTSGTWALHQIIDGYLDGHDWFGEAVAIEGDWAAVTAPDSIHIAGPIYLYQRGAANWTAAGILSDVSGWGLYGGQLDISLPRLIGGDPEYEGHGAAHVYLLPAFGGATNAEVFLESPDWDDDDKFGTSVAIEGDRAVVGAPLHDIAGLLSTGAAYVFERVGGAWQFRSKLIGNPPTYAERVGSAVALDGERILVGGNGTAYLFELSGTQWVQSARIAAPGASVNFGNAVALEGTRMLVGARDVQQVHAYTVTPGPIMYCTAKVNSQGCSPAIGFTGVPSATLAQPFAITAANVLNNKFGTLFYGTSGRLAAPFQGGFQCVAPPRQRTGLQWSAGNAGSDDCSGAYSYDLNARIQSGIDPALAAGVTVDAQYWTRDGQASFQTGLSNALELVITP